MESASSALRSDRNRPKSRSTNTPPEALVGEAVEAAVSKKAVDVTVMDLRSISGPAAYFVLCTGESDLQIKAIVDAVKGRVVEQCGERPWHVEGYEHKQWVLLDYVDTVVHVFDHERRAFYNLERLWADAEIKHIEDPEQPAADADTGS